VPLDGVVLAVTTRPQAVVLRALGLGDLLTAVPALRALRRGLSDHELVLAAPRAYTNLVRHAGLADRVAHLDGKDGVPRALPALGPEAVDVAVNLHGRGPASHRLLQRLAPGRLVAFHCPPVHAGAAQWDDEEHEARRWSRLVTVEGFPADPAELAIPGPGPGDSWAAGAIVLHPGAAAPARRWPVDRWSALAAGIRAGGGRVVVTAGPGERPLAADVARRAGLEADAAIGATDVMDLVEVIGRARAVVVGDTGVAHLAAALGRPSVVLFGPTSPARWGPPDRPGHRALWAGRTGDPHGRSADPGLLAIDVPDVEAALTQVVNAPGPPPTSGRADLPDGLGAVPAASPR